MTNHDDSVDETSTKWILAAVATASQVDALEARLQQAGAVALSLARLRAARERIGFLPLTFGDYVTGLASLASVALTPVLRWASIDSIAQVTAANAAGIGRLAHTLGFRLDELVAILRVTVAEQMAGEPLPILAAYRGASTKVTPQQCVRVLQQTEASLPLDERRELEALVHEASNAFHARAAESEQR